MKEGRFAEEIAPVAIPQRKGDPVLVEEDEGVRPGTTTESLGGLQPGVREGRHHHRRQRVADLRRRRRGHRHEPREGRGARRSRRSPSSSASGMVAGPDTSLLTQPSRAIKRALEPIDGKVSDIDLFELNEAFAAVGLAAMRDLGITDDIVNVNGGAIALGHPIGMSGTRIVITLDQRVASARRRPRCRGALRRRRPGRRRHHPGALIHRAGDGAMLSRGTSPTCRTGSCPPCCRWRRTRAG